jgi:hypothetical protein
VREGTYEQAAEYAAIGPRNFRMWANGLLEELLK